MQSPSTRIATVLFSLLLAACNRDAGKAAADGGVASDAATTTTQAAVDAGTAHDAAADAHASNAKKHAGSGTPNGAPPHKVDGFPPGAKCGPEHGGNDGCAYGSECVSGKCACQNGWTNCGGECRDTDRDFYNCGKCGHVCKKNEHCSYGGNCDVGW